MGYATTISNGSNRIHQRKQICMLNNCKSDIETIRCGVPQGANLGPPYYFSSKGKGCSGPRGAGGALSTTHDVVTGYHIIPGLHALVMYLGGVAVWVNDY